MAPGKASDSHARSHSLILLQRLLNLRDGASPLTLILDDLEQTARPVLGEILARAKLSRRKVIFVSFATLGKPRHVDVFVKAAGRDFKTVRNELMAHYPVLDPMQSRQGKGKTATTQQRAAVIIDSLNSLATAEPASLAASLSSILTPSVSLVGVYHADVPIVLPRSFNEYEPPALAMLCYLATAVLRLSSLPQEMERQKARDRALVEPEWGLREGREGAIVGLRPRMPGDDGRGVVIDMELRRRSGRPVTEKFILTPGAPGKMALLTDHAMFARPEPTEAAAGGDGDVEDGPRSTFDLGLTDKQRRDREGVVLPYFDAQTDIGGGEGGRILYDMGREDDFDDEDDED